jgi:PAS domain-containing protein
MITDEKVSPGGKPLREYEELFDLVTHRASYPAAQDFFGRPLEEGSTTPQQLMEAIHPDDVPLLAQVLVQVAEMKDGESLDYTLRFRHTDGRTVRAHYTSTPVQRGTNGLVKLLRSIVRWLDCE